MKEEIKRILVNIRIKRIINANNTRILRMGISLPKIQELIFLEHSKNLRGLIDTRIKKNWIQWYVNTSGISSPDYIPESIFYSIIEPILNKKEFNLAYSDKNFYDLFYPGLIFPKTLLRNIDGDFYDFNYDPIPISDNKDLIKIFDGIESIIVKPSIDTGGGRNVDKFFRTDNGFINTAGVKLDIDVLKSDYKKNYLIQPTLSQHSFYGRFNASSINTIRILTYRCVKSNTWKILQMILRVGRANSCVDNLRAGGYAIGIKTTGMLNEYATQKNGRKTTDVNDVSLFQNAFKIYKFEELKEAALSIAKRNIHSRLLGLDMMIDSNGQIKCIEINIIGNEINFYQLNNGPLFGEYTKDVLEYCTKNRDLLYEYYSI